MIERLLTAVTRGAADALASVERRLRRHPRPGAVSARESAVSAPAPADTAAPDNGRQRPSEGV